MLIEEKEAEERVNREDNLVNILKHRRIRTDHDYASGRKKGDKNLPEPIREMAASISAIQGPTVAARATGISVAQAHALGNGKRSSADDFVDPELKAKVDDQISKVNNEAVRVLMTSMGLLTEEKLKDQSPRVLSGVARDMASVMEKATPREKEDKRTQVLIYAPTSREENHYSVVEVDADVLE